MTLFLQSFHTKEMSHGYGFLTQSTIIPKKSKQIKMNDNSGQLLLQSILQKQKERLKSKSKNEKPVHPPQRKRNPGIEERIKKDEQQDEKTKLTEKNYYKCLQKKAEVYDKATNKKINIDKLLVDFQAKEVNNENQQQFQKVRQAFYKKEIQNIESMQKSLHENVETENSGTNMMRQRLAWEKQMLSQMNGIQSQEQKPKVIQSFDQKLSKQQKQAFQKIMNEEQEQKMRLQSIRRRKQLMEEQRIRKLRKLNIIKDVSEAAQIQRAERNHSQQNSEK